MVPFYDEHAIRLSRVLTDRGTEFCGTQSHEYELYLAVEDIDHSRTKTKSPQTNGICERFHRTVWDEFYRVAFRKKIYRTIDELQTDLDAWITEYNQQRPHQGRWCLIATWVVHRSRLGKLLVADRQQPESRPRMNIDKNARATPRVDR